MVLSKMTKEELELLSYTSQKNGIAVIRPRSYKTESDSKKVENRISPH